MLLGVIRPRTALRVMLVGMELVAARRVSARVTVRVVDTLSHRMQLDHHPWTVSHAMLVGMELVAARQVSAQVTAEQVAIPHHRVLLDRLRRTALVVLWARILTQQAALSASTVLWECMSTWLAAMRPPTASHAMLVGMELVAARQVSAQVTAEQVAIPHHRVQLDRLRRTASHVTQVDTALAVAQQGSVPGTVRSGDTRLSRLLLGLRPRIASLAKLGTSQV